MSYSEIEKEVFRKAVRELTFTPFIKLPVVCASSSENKLGRKEYDMVADNSEYVNERKRYQRLLFTFLLPPKKEKTSENKNDNDELQLTVSQLVAKPKIYDRALKLQRVDLYNYIAERLDVPPVAACSKTAESLREIATIDSNHPTYETIIKYYPQYCVDERNGFDFIEYILLLNISLTTQSRTLTMLQKLLNTPQNKSQINQWIDRVRESMYSSKVYLSYVDTFFSNFLYVTAKKYNESIIILRDEYDEPESRNADTDYYAYMETNAIMPEIIEIHNKIIPTAWRIINSQNENNPYRNEYLDKLDGVEVPVRLRAEKYAVEVKSYIDMAIKKAEDILPTLFKLKENKDSKEDLE